MFLLMYINPMSSVLHARKVYFRVLESLNWKVQQGISKLYGVIVFVYS